MIVSTEFVGGEENTGRDRAVLFIGDSYLEQYWPRVHHVVTAAPLDMPTVRFFTRGGCAPLRHQESRGPLCGGFLDAALAAADIIFKPPPVCSVSIETPKPAAASTAWFTVFGMS